MSHRSQLQCLNNQPSYHSHAMTPPSNNSSVFTMAPPQRTASQDSTSDNIRKRVCKACDRCRLKKSKCDGSNPCSRCKADNAICVFGERKRSHDKVYPKGYVEMLEQQQAQLVSGLQEMYTRLRDADAWPGEPLSEPNGHPLTHDILAALDLLELKQDGSGETERFEGDCQKLQSRLIGEGASYARRRASLSSDSEHSQQDPVRSVSQGTPSLSRQSMFKDEFDFSAPPTPQHQSPVPIPRQRPSFPATQASPLQQNSPMTTDPTFYQADWTYPVANDAGLMINSAEQAPGLNQLNQPMTMDNMAPFGQWDAPPYDPKFDPNLAGYSTYPQQQNPDTYPRMSDGGMLVDQMMEFEFNQFVRVLS